MESEQVKQSALIALINQNKFWSWLILITVPAVIIVLFHFKILTPQMFIHIWDSIIAKVDKLHF